MSSMALVLLLAGPMTPGRLYVSPDGYVEMLAGNLPLILTVPHDGSLYPATMTARTKALCGDPEFGAGADGRTSELSQQIAAQVTAATGRYPWMITNKIHRSRMDANRSRTVSACGDPETGAAWDQWHASIALARRAIQGRGFQLDIHGHSHALQRIELGYLLNRTQLASPEGSASESSLNAFATTPFTWLLRDLGSRLAAAGYPAVPSTQDIAPDAGEPYYAGGYLTERYGCPLVEDTICGVQVEHHMEGVRRTALQRAAYAKALVSVLVPFLAQIGVAW